MKNQELDQRKMLSELFVLFIEYMSDTTAHIVTIRDELARQNSNNNRTELKDEKRN